MGVYTICRSKRNTVSLPPIHNYLFRKKMMAIISCPAVMTQSKFRIGYHRFKQTESRLHAARVRQARSCVFCDHCGRRTDRVYIAESRMSISPLLSLHPFFDPLDVHAYHPASVMSRPHSVCGFPLRNTAHANWSTFFSSSSQYNLQPSPSPRQFVPGTLRDLFSKCGKFQNLLWKYLAESPCLMPIPNTLPGDPERPPLGSLLQATLKTGRRQLKFDAACLETT